jgi:hypothetical protein
MKYEKKLNILNNGSDESIKNLFEKEYKEFLEKERRDIAKHEKNLIFRKKK